MKNFVICLLLIVGFSSANYSQNKTDLPVLSKIYWIKYSLIFFEGCKPTVSPNNIIFDKGECSTNPYTGKIIPKGAEITLNSIDKNNKTAKVSISYLSNNYEVILSNKSKKDFLKSFILLFTEKELEEFDNENCADEVKTKKQLIECIGFPITATKENVIEKYFYIIEFTGFNSVGGSFDGFTVEIKNNKIIKVSGYI